MVRSDRKALNEKVMSPYTSVVLLTIIWVGRIEREKGGQGVGLLGKGLITPLTLSTG